MQDRNNHVNEQIVEKLLPGSLIYDIVNAKYKPEPEREPFYVQNKKEPKIANKSGVSSFPYIAQNIL